MQFTLRSRTSVLFLFLTRRHKFASCLRSHSRCRGTAPCASCYTDAPAHTFHPTGLGSEVGKKGPVPFSLLSGIPAQSALYAFTEYQCNAMPHTFPEWLLGDIASLCMNEHNNLHILPGADLRGETFLWLSSTCRWGDCP